MTAQTMLPEVGKWYKNRNGDNFEVVAIDEHTGTIEIQYFDGTLEEYDQDTWIEIHPHPVEAPEDYSGSMDIEPEDYGMDRDEHAPKDWNNPLDEFDS